MSTDTSPIRPSAAPASRLFGFAALLAALSLFWIATEQHYGACVNAQVAKYPAISVSALNGSATGPLKLSYDAERRSAVGDCKRFLVL